MAILRRETDMDSNTVKFRPGVRMGYALRDPVAVREAAETELDPGKTVTATTERGARHDAPHDERTPRDLMLDPTTQEALFSALDVRAAPTPQPNQELLRAYRRRPNADEAAPPADNPHADIKA